MVHIHYIIKNKFIIKIKIIIKTLNIYHKILLPSSVIKHSLGLPKKVKIALLVFSSKPVCKKFLLILLIIISGC